MSDDLASGDVAGDVDEVATSLSNALDQALRTTPVLPRDMAMVALARQYAAMLDDAVDRIGEAEEDDAGRDLARAVAIVAKIGPRFEATLDRLGMSPGARPAARGGEPHDGVTAAASALAGLQSGPAAGVDYASCVDPAVTAADA